MSPEEVVLVPQHNLFHVFADISNMLQRYLRRMLHFVSGTTPTHAYFVVAQAQHLVHHAGVSVTRHETALFTPNKKQKKTQPKMTCKPHTLTLSQQHSRPVSHERRDDIVPAINQQQQRSGVAALEVAGAVADGLATRVSCKFHWD